MLRLTAVSESDLDDDGEHHRTSLHVRLHGLPRGVADAASQRIRIDRSIERLDPLLDPGLNSVVELAANRR